ncbi:MAG: transketolase C-terminal domain-containing protein [Bacillota bacterium]
MSVRMDQLNTRQAFGIGLAEYARTNPNVFAIGADTTKSMGFQELKELYPDQVFNNGIAEQNMMLLGAGVASCGVKVFVGTYAPFASMRMLEQVRTFCAYPNLDVKVISGLSGLSGDIEGVTHQGIEDMSVMRAIPNMVVVCPADAASTIVITKKICEYVGPVYLRIGRNQVPTVFDDSYQFEVGKANVMRGEGGDAAIICNGAATHRALLAHRILESKGYQVRLIEMPCVKPIDEAAILEAAAGTGAIVTVEENNILGGLGGAVAEVLGEKCPTLMRRIGIDDRYTESGPHDELMDKYNLHPDHIVRVTEELIAVK